jgi:glycyl-radical enzyme activating protein
MPEECMLETGLIFDIQRTSLHDGPGIRTTVFFKGCPLHCLWCHNPESRSFKPQVSFNEEKCVHCLTCVEVCEHGAQLVENGRHIMAHDLCLACGSCVADCPQGALTLIGEAWTVGRVVAEVGRDFYFYKSSGGGVTLSGGEPMGQFKFARAILQACRERGIHTCLETSGFASQKMYVQLLPLTDIFLFDYKATQSGAHRAWTGVSNAQILSNLDFLYNQGAAIILRCPLIPGVNDNLDHLAGIASLAHKYPRLLGIELMPYHDLGKAKGLRLGEEYPLEHVKTADAATQQGWLETLAGLGCDKAVLG